MLSVLLTVHMPNGLMVASHTETFSGEREIACTLSVLMKILFSPNIHRHDVFQLINYWWLILVSTIKLNQCDNYIIHNLQA